MAWRPPIACRRSPNHGPRSRFCPDPCCPASGQTSAGNIRVHSCAERRYRCTACRKTFAATTGTAFYRPHKDPALFVCIVTLLAYGCPAQAIVAAFGPDERTVAAWQDEAGTHAQAAHHHFLPTSGVDPQHVQADEVRGRTAGGRRWVAPAPAAPPPLPPGGGGRPGGGPHL